MGYYCINNFNKECDGCNECNQYNIVICPSCGEELVNGDELFFEEFSDKVIGCTHCIYTKDIEDYTNE